MGAAESGGPIGAPGDFPIPNTIRVRVTGDPYCNTTIPYTVEVVDFKEPGFNYQVQQRAND